MTENPNPGFLIFHRFFSRKCGGTGQGKGRKEGAVGRGVGAITFICEFVAHCINQLHFAFHFYEAIP